MTRIQKISLLCLSVAAICGCASDDGSDIFLADSFGFKRVCLVDNQNVPPAFFIALRKALEDKGLEVETISKVIELGPGACPAAVTYEARYAGGAARRYVADATLKLLLPDGRVETVSVKAAQAPVPLLDKAADPELTVRSLVNRLLPRTTPW